MTLLASKSEIRIEAPSGANVTQLSGCPALDRNGADGPTLQTWDRSETRQSDGPVVTSHWPSGANALAGKTTSRANDGTAVVSPRRTTATPSSKFSATRSPAGS